MVRFCGCVVAAVALVIAVGPVNADDSAMELRWEWDEHAASLTTSLIHNARKYEVTVVRPPDETFPVLEFTIRIRKDGKELHAWKGHYASVFEERDGVLYYPIFNPHSTGCALVAFDLTNGKLLWKTKLKGIGPVGHSKYSNQVNLELSDTVVTVFAKESFCRYVEHVDRVTGKTVAHKKFPNP